MIYIRRILRVSIIQRVAISISNRISDGNRTVGITLASHIGLLRHHRRSGNCVHLNSNGCLRSTAIRIGDRHRIVVGTTVGSGHHRIGIGGIEAVGWSPCVGKRSRAVHQRSRQHHTLAFAHSSISLMERQHRHSRQCVMNRVSGLQAATIGQSNRHIAISICGCSSRRRLFHINIGL